MWVSEWTKCNKKKKKCPQQKISEKEKHNEIYFSLIVFVDEFDIYFVPAEFHIWFDGFAVCNISSMLNLFSQFIFVFISSIWISQYI